MKPSTECAIIIATVLGIIAAIEADDARSPRSSPAEARNRDKRSLFFPYNAAQGLLWALAVPLTIPDRNFFVSYNFECNYNNPTTSNVFTEGFYHYLLWALAVPLGIPDRNVFVSYNFEGNYNNPTTSNVFTEGFFHYFCYGRRWGLKKLFKMKPSTKCGIIIAAIILGTSVAIEFPQSDKVRSRTKRTLFFPYNSCIGLLWAIAIPLGVPDRNIFMSYNFEGNYNSPTALHVFTEGFWNYIRGIAPPLETPAIYIHRSMQGNAEVVNSTGSSELESNEFDVTTTVPEEPESVERALRAVPDFPRKFVTRKKIYHGIEEHLIKNGFNGKKCLLRAICDAAELPMVENNGVFGDLVHILLTPSASEDEQLPAEFYKAERLGQEGRCRKYHKHCQHDILDLFSFIME